VPSELPINVLYEESVWGSLLKHLQCRSVMAPRLLRNGSLDVLKPERNGIGEDW
jgi:hypothetical protein